MLTAKASFVLRGSAACSMKYTAIALSVWYCSVRARGDAREDSDCDVAVFRRGMGDRMAEMNRLTDLSTAVLDETGELIHAMPHGADSYSERTPLMHEIRAEGIDL